MDDKKVVNTQHVKYIETLSRAQNMNLLTPTSNTTEAADAAAQDAADDVPDTGLATSAASDTGSYPVGGASQPAQPPTPQVHTRMATRKADQRKPSQRVRDILSAFIESLDNEDKNDEPILCNAVEGLDPPNYNAAMKTPAAEMENSHRGRTKKPAGQSNMDCSREAA